MKNSLSFEEIDDLVAELAKEKQLEFNFAPGFNWEEKPKELSKCPPHNFVEYLGLNESFLHCSLCGEKKV